MSYDKSYSGSLDRPERDRSSHYSPYSGTTKKTKKHGNSYYAELLNENGSSSYRRTDSPRDYYGYRLSYPRKHSGPPGRRRTDKYDLYQGSKYRPQKRTPLGGDRLYGDRLDRLGLDPDAVAPNAASLALPAGSSLPSATPSATPSTTPSVLSSVAPSGLGPSALAAPPSSFIIDERRLSNRRQEWEQKQARPAGRKDFRSEDHRSSDPFIRKPELPKKEDPVSHSDSKVFTFKERDRRDKLLHMFDDDREPKRSDRLRTPEMRHSEDHHDLGSHNSKNPSRKGSFESIKYERDEYRPNEAKSRRNSKDHEHTKTEDSTASSNLFVSENSLNIKRAELLEKPDSEEKKEIEENEKKEAEKKKEAEEAEREKQKQEEEALKEEERKEAERREKEAEIKEAEKKREEAHAAQVREAEKKKEAFRSESGDEEMSEAETVAEETILTDLARKVRADEERRRSKRKIIYSSDEEEEHVTPAPEKNVISDNSGNSDNKKTYKVKRDLTGRLQLQRACKKGDLAAVKLLISRGADANESDYGGFTCLHEASLAGHADIVKFLLESGADVNRQALEAGDYETPLMDAAENRHTETVRILLEHGADPNITNSDGFSALTKIYHLQADNAEDYEEVIQLLDSATDAPVLKATLQLPRKILDDPNEAYFNDLVKKKSSMTAIFRFAAQGLKEAAAEDFVLNGYTLQKNLDILILAARAGNVELVDIFLGLDPGPFDINLKNPAGVSVLLASVGRGNYDVVKFLLEKGADPNVTRSDNLNALQIAKHSANHDPREVFLLEKYMGDEEPESPSRKRKLVEEEKEVKRPKVSEIPEIPEKLVKSEEAKPPKTEKPPKPAEPVKHEEPERKKSELGEPLSKKASHEKDSTPDMEGKPKSGPSSPPQNPKILEEQRQKALEEAKIWQQKVQAKKKARKEMFLQAEKEKEKRRKEEEEKRAEREKEEKLRLQQLEQQKAQEAEQKARDLENKKTLLENQLILAKYPIGLREAKFGVDLTPQEKLKYLPVYVFLIGGELYVVDMQIALLLATPVDHVNSRTNGDKIELSTETKLKLWVLFCPMVGILLELAMEPDGAEKFSGLLLKFVKFDLVASLVQEKDLELYEQFWKAGKAVKVDLEDLPEPKKKNTELPEKKPEPVFVPPKCRLRGDVVQTVATAHKPLW